MLQSSNDAITEQLEAMQKEKCEAESKVEEMKQQMDELQITKESDKQKIDQLETQVSDIALEN